MNKEDGKQGFIESIKSFLRNEPDSIIDLVSMIRKAKERNLVSEETLSLIEGAIYFADLRVREVMIPKNQMVCIDENADLERVISIVASSGHSRFPVFNEDKSDIIGILHAKDLIKFQTPDAGIFDLHDILRTPIFIPESKPLDKLLTEFRSNRNHMAIVVDEYGEISGFITIEDIIEQIIGDIEDEFDIDEEAYIKPHERNHYIIKAHTPIEEFNRTLNVDFKDETYDTIGGLVLKAFGHLPYKGESINVDGFEFKVLNADARRIKLLDCLDKRISHNE